MVLHLVLLRHAPAAERDPSRWPNDSERPLTPAGRRDARRVVEGLKAAEVAPTRILTSPAARCSATAAIAAEVLARGRSRPVVAWPELAFSGNAQAVVDRLRRERVERGCALLVGHEPLLGRLVGLLVFGEDVPAVRLRRAGACRLEMPKSVVPGSARIDWLLTRGQLARLGTRA